MGLDKVLPQQETLDRLAARIERAFTLRRPFWYQGCSSDRVWSVAAMVLWEAQHDQQDIPIDPELYVASQPFESSLCDPWSTVAVKEAGRRYRTRVRRLIRQLRGELAREIDRAESMLRKGKGLSEVLESSRVRFTPLALYITASRSGRPDLAARLRPQAVEQHQSCPLYRLAARALLAEEQYPVDVEPVAIEPALQGATHGSRSELALLN